MFCIKITEHIDVLNSSKFLRPFTEIEQRSSQQASYWITLKYKKCNETCRALNSKAVVENIL